MSTPAVRPLYLLADSQLLFWSSGSQSFLASLIEVSGCPAPRVAYIGASNGDSDDAYSIFNAAFAAIDVRSRHRVRSSFGAEDREFLETGDVIVLAGGDVEAGWTVFNQTGMREHIESRYRAGAVLIGISAGAIQLGTHAVVSSGEGASRLIQTFGFVPFIVDVHDEQRDWQILADTIEMLEGSATGVGIPSGGGLIAHPDGTIECVRRSAYEFACVEGKLRRSIASPRSADDLDRAGLR